VEFREQSGSTKPVSLLKTVNELGVVLPDGQAHVPTLQQAQEAVNTDRQNGNKEATDALFLKYRTMNADVGNPIVALRRALTDLIKAGAFLEDHKIDGQNYRWEGDELGLSAQWRTDDANGAITGIPNLEYLAFTGAAVWGGDWQEEFRRKIKEARAQDLDEINDFEQDEMIEEDERDENRDAGNDDGVLTLHIPAGVSLVRIFVG